MLERIGVFLVKAVDRGSERFTLLFAIFFSFGALDFAVGAVVSFMHLSFIAHGLIDAVILGGLAAIAAWFLLESASERRKGIREQIEESARLNHEIRNALEVIGQAGYLLNDIVYGRVIAESVERIERSLRERKKLDSE